MMRAMGATVVLVEQSDPEQGITKEDMKRVEDTADNLAEEHKAFRRTSSSARRIPKPITSTNRNGSGRRGEPSMPSVISWEPAGASQA